MYIFVNGFLAFIGNMIVIFKNSNKYLLKIANFI